MTYHNMKPFIQLWRTFILSTLFVFQGAVAQDIKRETKPAYVFQSERKIPISKTVDIVIVGGSVAAVSAAVAASKDGAKVFLIAPRPYLGEDICATLRLEIKKDRVLNTSLEKKIFGNKLATTPLKVKAILNQELLDANVEFIFGSYVTDVLQNDSKQPSGVIISNRAGRQAILAKSIIDATDRAWISRMSGATSEEWYGSELTFERTLVMPGTNKDTPKYEKHQISIEMPDLHFSSFAKAEQIARAKTYTDGQLRASESLFHVPPDPIICKKNHNDWSNEEEIDIGYFQAVNFENLYVLSSSSGIPRSVADSLLAPAALAGIGTMVGHHAAERIKGIKKISEIIFNNPEHDSESGGDVKENLEGFRPIIQNEMPLDFPQTTVPILGRYDVVVVGGGTSGAPAAISAARHGLKVLVVEYQEGLGGVGTLGFIGKPYHGRDVGFAAEVPFPVGNIEPKMEWYRSELAKAGGDIWLGVLGCGAYVEGNLVKGAVIATPENRGVVLAKVVIDATGSGDIAIAAGSDYRYGDIEKGDIALQGTGLPSRSLTGNYFNTDYLIVDETDMLDVWRTLVSVQQTKYTEDSYDAGTLIQNRERRRISGEFTLSYLDQVVGRTFPDAIVYSGSDYDSHGYPSDPYFALLPHDSISRKQNHPAPGGTCYTPYRCLIPKNIDGILVTGLGISMDRDASAMVRMQLDLANQGYAAGVAASLAIKAHKVPRDVDVKELQRILVEKGNIPEEVIELKDSFPLPLDTVKQAVHDYGLATNPTTAGKPLAIILTHQNIALPLIQAKFLTSTGQTKLLYAQVLGMCGIDDGLSTLLDELDQFTVWDDKIYQGSMADYAHLPTPIDAVILAIGNSHLDEAPVQLLNMMDKLDKNVTLSHHRSLALALEKISDPEAAIHLAKLLQKPDMQGYAMLEYENALVGIKANGVVRSRRSEPIEKRTKALREIVLVRALYHCGDYNDVGKNILLSYEKDMRGLFARHAYAILHEKKNALDTPVNTNINR